VKAREVIRELERDGWYLHSQRGSHRHYKHPTKPGKITISHKDGDDLRDFIVKRIRQQAGL
jgi:predicted RNA binding protein YcfA (HicA-like mRNA interferase family)